MTRFLPVMVTALMVAGCGVGTIPDSGRVGATIASATIGPGSVTSTRPDRPVDKPASRSERQSLTWDSAALSDRARPAPEPTRLIIPSLGVDSTIVSMGVADDGQMEVPGNVTEVGWYSFGSSPGEKGSAVLAAHVDMAGAGPGVFYDIDRLIKDDIARVRFGDGSTMLFVVTATDQVPKPDLDIETLFARTGEPVLRLVTCGGGFNPGIRHYEDNIVVTLAPIESVPS